MSDRDAMFEIFTCETNGLFKYPIRFATGGKQTHSYLTVGENDRGIRPGAWSMEPGGFKWRDYDYWGANNPHSKFQLNGKEIELFLDFIVAHKKARYDFLGDFIVGLDDLTPGFFDRGFNWIEHIEDKLSWAWFCSAFTDAAMSATGRVVIEGRKTWEQHGVTPMDLFRSFVARGWALATDE